MTDRHVVEYVRSSLPPAPARVLEVGAGSGELAEALRAAGYDVLAVDPAATTPPVERLALLEVAEAPGSFDAAVAVTSLHHVEPLAESCAHLAELVRPGGILVVDEFDIGRFDERAAGWWSAHHAEHPHPGDTVAALRHHLHRIESIVDALDPLFELSPLVRGAYLYRFQLSAALRPEEERAIGSGVLDATGVRFVGIRRRS